MCMCVLAERDGEVLDAQGCLRPMTLKERILITLSLLHPTSILHSHYHTLHTSCNLSPIFIGRGTLDQEPQDQNESGCEGSEG